MKVKLWIVGKAEPIVIGNATAPFFWVNPDRVEVGSLDNSSKVVVMDHHLEALIILDDDGAMEQVYDRPWRPGGVPA
jgi:hypothetical protein